MTGWTYTWSALAAVAAILVSPLGARADGLANTDAVPRLVHYEGTLERDGAAVTGDVSMVFRIFDGSNPVWNEPQTVKVYAGRFSVLLGSSSAASANSLASAIAAADDLYLGVSLVVEGAEVTLTNRQRFTPVPYSLWTTAATTLKVGAGLDVYGPDVKFQTHPDRGDGGRALSHYFSDRLYLNFDGDFAGGVIIGDPPDPSTAPSLQVNGPTTLAGTATVNGALTANDDASVAGDLTVTGMARLGLTTVTCVGTGSCPCPAGTALIGGGGDCTGNAFLHESYPSTAENRWQVYCRENGGPVAPEGSYAICARLGN